MAHFWRCHSTDVSETDLAQWACCKDGRTRNNTGRDGGRFELAYKAHRERVEGRVHAAREEALEEEQVQEDDGDTDREADDVMEDEGDGQEGTHEAWGTVEQRA